MTANNQATHRTSRSGVLSNGPSTARSRRWQTLGGHTKVWNLDDKAVYFQLLDTTIPYAFTWGSKDLEKRETIRKAVAPVFPATLPAANWWAFRIYVRKGGVHSYDVENIPKLIVDAFSGSQLNRDRSSYRELELYDDDKVANVAMVLVAGETSNDGDSTRIEIFGRKPCAT